MINNSSIAINWYIALVRVNINLKYGCTSKERGIPMRKGRKFLAILLTFLTIFSNQSFVSASTNLGVTGGMTREEAIREQEQKESDKASSSEKTASGGWGVPATSIKNQGVSDGLIHQEVQVSKTEKNTTLDLKKDEKKDELSLNKEKEYDPDEMVNVVVVLDEKGLLEKGIEVKDLKKSRARTLEKNMIKKINSLESHIEKKILDGEELEVKYTYTVATCGMAISIPYKDLETIKAMDGVKTAFISPEYTIDPNLTTSGDMISIGQAWNTAGFTGSGMRVSVIDTGIDLTHDAFQATDNFKGTLTGTSLTKDEIAAVQDRLNAKSQYKKFDVSKVYRSEKVPYAFNYVDSTMTVGHGDGQGDHGTHVAGIVAANPVEGESAVGIAKDAQLIIMKVFGNNGGAYFSDILAALEDSLVLNVDVINLSLGSTAGFSSEDPIVDEIYSRISSTDTVVAVAAGNEYSSAYGNLTGEGKPLTSNPDNGNVGSPSTYYGATSVASVNNTNVMSSYFVVGDKNITFNDTGVASAFTKLYSAGGNNTYEYAFATGVGKSVEDFANCKGKIAVVSRGEVAFTVKQANARAAGAIACIVYNNEPGTISMQIEDGTIPCISITLEDGTYLLKQVAETGVGTLTIAGNKLSFPSNDAYTLSDFSCWGVTPSLELKPELAAPGGNIYSTRDNNTYGLMSGTSMASPHVAGAAAILLQSIRLAHPEFKDGQIHDLANALLMSTATPLEESEGVEYSPRKQGAGLMNIYNAIMTSTYLTVEGQDKPKISFGDDKDKTGIYNFSFEANNYSKEDSYYTLDASVLTENYYTKYDVNFMAESAKELAAAIAFSSKTLTYIYDFNTDNKVDEKDALTLLKYVNQSATISERAALVADVNEDGVISVADAQVLLQAINGVDNGIPLLEQELMVPANGKTTIDITINLSKEDKEYMDTIFEHGVYVDGFVYLNSKNSDAIDLTIPYMGFYGDWTEAPIFDDAFWYEDIKDTNATTYYNVAWGSGSLLLGTNPYVEEEEYKEDRNAFSPNEDGYHDYMEDFYLGMLRSAKSLTFTYEDVKTKEVYYSWTADYVRKSLYDSTYSTIYPFSFYNYMEDENDLYYLTDKNGDYLTDGTKLNLTIKAELDYDKHEGSNKSDTIKVPITIDTKAPVVDLDTIQMTYDPETKKNYLTLSITDNQYTAAVIFVDETGYTELSKNAVNQKQAGETVTLTYDVTGYGDTFQVIIGDYACNEVNYTIQYVSESGEDNYKDLDENRYYGYKLYEGSSNAYGWISFDLETKSSHEDGTDYLVLSKEKIEASDSKIAAAEYLNGYVFGVDQSKHFYAIQPGSWKRTLIATLDKNVIDMAFDYASGKLYGLTADGYLVTLNPITGEMLRIAQIIGEEGYAYYPLALACSTEGQIYCSSSTTMYTVDKTTAKATKLSDHNLGASALQSMAYDHTAGKLLWASNTYYKGTLYEVNTSSGELTRISTLGNEAEIAGLFRVYSDGKNYIDATDVTGVTLDKNTLISIVGSTQQLKHEVKPWTALERGVTWSSSDDSIARVDQNGNVTGAKEGTATITVTTKDGNFKDNCEVTVKEIKGTLQGFRFASIKDKDLDWVTFDVNDSEHPTTIVEPLDNPIGWYAAEYYNGYIYGYDINGNFYRMDTKTKETLKVCDSFGDYTMIDMAFNYNDGSMYVMYKDNSVNATWLGRVSLVNGSIEYIGVVRGNNSTQMYGLACKSDGTFYTVDSNGMLLRFVIQTYGSYSYLATQEIGFTGIKPYYMQSLAYDHDNENLYWAECHWISDYSKDTWNLVWLDMESGAGVGLGPIGTGAEVMGLYSIPTKVTPPVIPVTSIEIVENITMLEKMRLPVEAKVSPMNATNQEITWEIEDTTIATIDRVGTITSLKPGKTKVTATIHDNGTLVRKTSVLTVAPSAGYVNAFVNYDKYFGLSNFWGTFIDANPRDIFTDKDWEIDYVVEAAEYYNDSIYAIALDKKDYDRGLYKINPESYEVEFISSVKGNITDLAFDYSTGAMFGVERLASISNLVNIDIKTGKVVTVAKLKEQLQALGCTTEGALYGITTTGKWCEFGENFTVKVSTNAIVKVDYTNDKYITMAFDHTTKNMYFAAADSLYLMDLTSGTPTKLGKVGYNGARLNGLYIIPEENPTIPEGVAPIAIQLSTNNLVVFKGEASQLELQVIPVSDATKQEVIWSVEDPSIATIDENGLVTGVNFGTTKVTVTTIDHKLSASCVVRVVDSSIQLYAYDDQYGDSGWVNFSPYAPEKISSTTPETGNTVIAAEYYNGKVYGYENGGTFFSADFNNLGKRTYYNTGSVESVKDMTYDYSTDTMYVVTGVSYNDGKSNLYSVDLSTGRLTKVCSFSNVNLTMIACTTEGELYAYNAYRNMFVRLILSETEEGTVTGTCEAIGNRISFDMLNDASSLSYDHNTGIMYMVASAYDSTTYTYTGGLYTVDLSNGTATLVGKTNLDLVALFSPYTKK